jgi:putative sugar O-methyltransferase
MHKHYFGKNINKRDKKIFLYDALHRYKLWKSLSSDKYTVQDLISPRIGNPYGVFIDDVFVKSGADYLHYYAMAISRLIRGKNKRFVVELGGGYGGMAYYLCRENENMTYIDFDLPENMALTAYYLSNAFPEKKVLLFGEAPLTPETMNAYDIILMPGFEIAKLLDESVDLIFNSYSLAEMSRDTIHTYITEFMRISKGYFFHVNHNKVSTTIADNFGVDLNRFDLLYKIPALWNAGRNLYMDEYEYLYKKH